MIDAEEHVATIPAANRILLIVFECFMKPPSERMEGCICDPPFDLIWGHSNIGNKSRSACRPRYCSPPRRPPGGRFVGLHFFKRSTSKTFHLHGRDSSADVWRCGT